jgi:hypothetical protein
MALNPLKGYVSFESTVSQCPYGCTTQNSTNISYKIRSVNFQQYEYHDPRHLVFHLIK